MDERYEPKLTEVKRDEGVTITFHDDHVAHFDLLTLRQNCPCAGCRGQRDRGELAWPRAGSPTPLAISDAEFHGAWALHITWNDGHAAGMYPFESLRRWSEGDEAFPPDSGMGR